MYPFVEERLHEMQQRRIDACKNIPANHRLQPPMIGPIQFVPADAEGAVDYTGSDSANIVYHHLILTLQPKQFKLLNHLSFRT